jgi:hypothetical protein
MHSSWPCGALAYRKSINPGAKVQPATPQYEIKSPIHVKLRFISFVIKISIFTSVVNIISSSAGEEISPKWFLPFSLPD